MQRQLDQHALAEIADRGNEDGPARQARVAGDLGQVLVRQTQAVDLKQGRGAGLIGLDHAAPATGVTTHSRQAQRKVWRNQARVHQRADQRDGAGGVATGVGDAACGLHGGLLAGGQFGKAKDPAGGGAVRGRGVNDLGAGLAAGLGHGVNHRHGFAGGIVVQAQNDHIDAGHQGALGVGVLAQLRGDADQLDAGQGLQAFPDLQAGGTGFAVDKNLGHGALSCFCGGLSDAATARAGHSGA